MISFKKITILLTFFFVHLLSQADNYPTFSPWSMLVYYGTLSETNLLSVFKFNAKTGLENITSLEVDYELSPQNMIRRYFAPFITTVSFANNVSYIDDPEGPIYEYDPFLLFQWKHFPWDKYIITAFGIGWGVSYDTRVSTWEKHDSDNTKKLLNYLDFEVSLALPIYPRLQLILREHHRSGAFGLYGADNAGSNFIGGGLRYNF